MRLHFLKITNFGAWNYTAPFIKNGLKNTLQILIILIFNNFLAQNKLENAPKNSDKATAVSKTDTLKIEKEQIDDIVRSKADNIRNEVPKKMSSLNQNAEVSYQDMKINADYIQIDWDKGLIFARGKVDSTGKNYRTCCCNSRW